MVYTPAKGTLLQLEIASVYTTVAQRVRVAPPERTREEIDTTDLDSDDESSIPGIRRGGEVELVCNYDPANATHAALLTSYNNGTVESWKVVYADSGAGEDSFDGWISSYKKGEAEVDGLVTLELTIKVTGNVSFTA